MERAIVLKTQEKPQKHLNERQYDFAFLQFTELRNEIHDRLERVSKLVNILLSSSLIYVVAVFLPLQGLEDNQTLVNGGATVSPTETLAFLFILLVLIVPLLCFALEVMVTSETDAIARAGHFIRAQIEENIVDSYSQGWEGWLNVQESSFGKRTSEKIAKLSRYLVICLYCLLSATIGGMLISKITDFHPLLVGFQILVSYALVGGYLFTGLLRTQNDEMVEQLYGVLIVDIDGCLAHSDGSISKANIQALERVAKQNVSIILATGRAHFGVIDVLSQLDLPGLHAVANGACIYHHPRDQVEILSPLPTDAVTDLSCRASEKGILWAGFGERGIYCETGREDELRAALIERGDIPGGSDMTPIFPVDGPCENKEIGPVFKFWCLVEESDIERNNFISGLALKGIDGLRTTSQTYEFFARGVNKIDAVRHIVKEYSLEEERILALGDYDNDLDILRWADDGYAPLNASPKVRRQLGQIKIRKSNDEDFVAHVINDLFR